MHELYEQATALTSRHSSNRVGTWTTFRVFFVAEYFDNIQKYLLRPREQLRSIVMSLSVCLSLCGLSVHGSVGLCVYVCLSDRISPEPHAGSLPNFCACCLCPWLGPPPTCLR